jgi:RNA recognition motif-containing protein
LLALSGFQFLSLLAFVSLTGKFYMQIHVSNLGLQITDESLRATFAAHGEVSHTEIAMDAFTGLPRGFAVVSMPNDNEATNAIAHIDGSVINGVAISAAQAVPKRELQGSYAVGINAKK